MKNNPEVTKSDSLMDMKLRDVMAIVQGYNNKDMVENMRKKHLHEMEINVDLNNTF